MYAYGFCSVCLCSSIAQNCAESPVRGSEWYTDVLDEMECWMWPTTQYKLAPMLKVEYYFTNAIKAHIKGGKWW